MEIGKRKKVMQNKKADIEKLLKEGNTIQLKPRGYSMYPLFIPGRDEAVIAPADPAKLKRGDVVLYRRETGILVLHRICRRKKEGFYMVGDNQTEIEGPLKETQIKGILVAFVRNGRYTEVTHPFYRITSRIWLFLRPWRHPIMDVCGKVKKMVRSIIN